MSLSPDAARQQAAKDFSAGKSATNTAGWPAPAKEAYDAELKRQQEQQRRK